MVSEGRLPDADLLYFFTLEELKDLLETRTPGLISKAIHRRKIFPTLEKYVFPEYVLPEPINDEADSADAHEYIADITMKGTPVYQRVTKGYARVAVSLEEVGHLKPGEILITLSTDIDWSPYFPIVSGGVTGILWLYKLKHFHFYWKASSEVYDCTLDTNPDGFADAIARSEWKVPFVPPIKDHRCTEYVAQTGVVTGTVSVNDESDYEMYLFGERIRNLGQTYEFKGSITEPIVFYRGQGWSGYLDLSYIEFTVGNRRRSGLKFSG
ncbi:phosphoenolpyruvate synthase [Caerostris extrusa]|uniref:Phosphoenolpyruvate synthase n=1 Tax=Caerostris extrusa TaxID=172846 RepID=A0AAV4TPE3_CAEEX|nr:phosphoenolpyruvate synthase [Caerostris extrusa]